MDVHTPTKASGTMGVLRHVNILGKCCLLRAMLCSLTFFFFISGFHIFFFVPLNVQNVDHTSTSPGRAHSYENFVSYGCATACKYSSM